MASSFRHLMLIAVLSVVACPGFGQTPKRQVSDVPVSSGSVASTSHEALLARTGTIVLKVASFDAAGVDVTNAAIAHGGEIVNSSTRTDIKGRKFGSLVFRLPADQIPAVTTEVSGAGKLFAQKFDAVDNRSDFEGLARRVDSLGRHEDRLSGILNSPRRMRGGDILFLQERLFRADVDREMMLQQRDDLVSASQMASLKIELFEPGTIPIDESVSKVDLRRWYSYALLRARHEFERSAARGTTGLAYLAVYAPIWVPLLIVALTVLWILWRLRRRILSAVTRFLAAIIRGIANAFRRIRGVRIGRTSAP